MPSDHTKRIVDATEEAARGDPELPRLRWWLIRVLLAEEAPDAAGLPSLGSEQFGCLLLGEAQQVLLGRPKALGQEPLDVAQDLRPSQDSEDTDPPKVTKRKHLKMRCENVVTCWFLSGDLF